VVNKAHNRHQNNFPKSSYLGVALAHTMRVSERASAHFAILSLHFRSVSARSLLLSSTLPRQFSISAMSQQCMQKRVCDSLAPPSLRPSILWIFNNRSSTNTQAHSDCSAATAYRKVVIKTSSFFKSSQLPRFLGHSPTKSHSPSITPSSLLCA